MNRWIFLFAVPAALAPSAGWAQGKGDDWKRDFDLAACTLKDEGKGRYFVLEPGFQLTLEGDGTKVQISVLNETRRVGDVVTRVVEEREWKKGQLYEVARNFFAFCEETRDVYYFGEDVDFYKNGKVVSHEGSWLAGTNGNKPGLAMPGSPKPKMKYYQELAPGQAMDRAEVISLGETCKTPAGTFENCLKVKESSQLEPSVAEHKYHAPNIGLVRDEDLVLTSYGFVKAATSN